MRTWSGSLERALRERVRAREQHVVFEMDVKGHERLEFAQAVIAAGGGGARARGRGVLAARRRANGREVRAGVLVFGFERRLRGDEARRVGGACESGVEALDQREYFCLFEPGVRRDIRDERL